MATASIAGFKGKILIGGTAVAELTDATLEVTSKLYNATSHDSGGWEENIVGNNAWKATAKTLYAETDAQRVALRNALINKTSVTFEFDPLVSATHEKFTGTGFVDKYTHGAPNENVQTIDLEIVGTGALVAGTQ
jgi:predicted secreted protein